MTMTGCPPDTTTVAGTPVHLAGRTIVPIVTRQTLRTGGGVFLMMEPVGLLVMDDDHEYYIPLGRGGEECPAFPADTRAAFRKAGRKVPDDGGAC
jgi:hypothetical protein